MRLAAEAEAENYRLLALDATGSTNDDAARAAREGDPGHLWIVARVQHDGRGRHGRSWASLEGNLFASLLLIEPCAQRHAAQMGFLAGLALREAVTAVVPHAAPRLTLKWPNDVLLDGAKLGGVLLEGHRAPGGAFALVVGCGVNVARAPGGTPYPAARIADVAPAIDRIRLFEALSRAVARRVRTWREAPATEERFAGLRREWLDHAAGLDGPVTLRLPAGDRSGRFVGLDEHGRLRLETDTGVEILDAGDLYFTNRRAGGEIRPDGL